MFFESLRVRDGVWFRAQGLILIFCVVYTIPYFRRYLDAIWDLLKFEVYYIGGACRHSGMCCNGLSLVIQGARMDTLSQFDQVQTQNPVYRRFIPHMDSGGEIDHFICRCLTSDNRCNDYENRPKVCRQYPTSAFIQHDHIISGCGYKVMRRSFRWAMWIPGPADRKLGLTDAVNRIDSLMPD